MTGRKRCVVQPDTRSASPAARGIGRAGHGNEVGGRTVKQIEPVDDCGIVMACRRLGPSESKRGRHPEDAIVWPALSRESS